MDAPKIEIPIIDRLDFVFKPGGQRASAQSMGGQIPKAELDASGETGMYRGEINIPKSWIRDSNFAAVEETLNVAGQAVAVTVEKKVIDDLISNASQTDTKANLDGVSALFFEAFVEVVDNKLPTNGFICDTAVFHPADYAALVRENSSGNFPWYNSLYRDKVAGRDGLFFQGVRSPVKIIVADADAATVDTVMFYNKLKALALGIRQDLTIEDFDDVRQGIEGAVLTMQFVTAEIRDKAAYKATVW